MDVQIQRATIEDANDISSLSYELGYDITPAKTRALIQEISRDDQHIIYLAVSGSEVIGWIHAFKTTRLESGIFCEIAGMVVSEKSRNKGVGGLMVHHIKEWCKEMNVAVLRVRCNEKRVVAHRFYS